MKPFNLLLSLVLVSASCADTQTPQKKHGEITQKKTSKKMKTSILFVLTSHEVLGETDTKTGLWLEEFTTPYYALLDQGVAITLASPKGGKPPIDPKSELEEAQTASTQRFLSDKENQAALENTVRLAEVNANDFDAIFYPGGHGPLWDLAEDKHSIALIEAFYDHGKPVAAVCHGPAVFKHTKKKDGSYLVDGKKVTGFSDTEEEAVALSAIVPFSIEQMLTEHGGHYSRGEDWEPYALEDGLLITGQNPASADLVAELLLKKLK